MRIFQRLFFKKLIFLFYLLQKKFKILNFFSKFDSLYEIFFLNLNPIMFKLFNTFSGSIWNEFKELLQDYVKRIKEKNDRKKR